MPRVIDKSEKLRQPVCVHMSKFLASQGLLHYRFSRFKRAALTDQTSKLLIKAHSSPVGDIEVDMGNKRDQVLLQFGLLSDVQYTPLPAEGFSFHGNPRCVECI